MAAVGSPYNDPNQQGGPGGNTGTPGSTTGGNNAGGTPGNAGASSDLAPLTLKVMRLCRPSLYRGTEVYSESRDMFHGEGTLDSEAAFFSGNNNAGEAKEAVAVEGSSCPGGNLFGLSSFLALPRGFGNIYLGEVFGSFIAINNPTSMGVTNVAVKVELQTPTQRTSLLDLADAPIPYFESGQSHDYVVEHELKELGVHILVCSATYYTPEAEQKQFRKFYRFQVLSPLQVKTHLHHLLDHVFVEAQLQNSTSGPICMDSVAFEPSPFYLMEDLNTNIEHDSVAVPKALEPGDVRQYLYRLSPAKQGGRIASTLGKIEIVWRGQLGEPGRLQTSQVQRKTPASQDLLFSVASVPTSIPVATPFEIVIRVTNRTDREIELLSQNGEQGRAIVIVGYTGKSIGVWAPQETKPLSVTLIALEPGVQQVSGLRLVDKTTSKVFDLENLCEVYVEGHEQ